MEIPWRRRVTANSSRDLLRSTQQPRWYTTPDGGEIPAKFNIPALVAAKLRDWGRRGRGSGHEIARLRRKLRIPATFKTTIFFAPVSPLSGTRHFRVPLSGMCLINLVSVPRHMHAALQKPLI